MDSSNPKLHFAKQAIVLHKDSKSHEKFMMDIYVAVASQYSNNLSEETKKGLDEKAAQGWFPGSHKRGYRTIGDMGHKIWVIDEDTSDHIFIPKAFELYDTGNYTLRTLSKELFSQGWTTREAKPIVNGETHRILTDPFYCGEFIWKDKLYKHGKHTPLVSKELFYSVQERMKKKYKAGKFKRHEFLYGGGLIICGECNRVVTAETHKGHNYYHCTKYGNNCTQRKFIREENIENQVIQVLDQLKLDSPRLIEWVIKALKEAHKIEADYHFTTLKELDDQLLKIEKRLSVLYDDRVDGVITKEHYERKRVQYEAEAEALLEAKEKHIHADVDYRKLGMNIFELAQKGREIYHTMATMNEKKELLSFVFSNLILKDEKVVPAFQNGFEVVALRAKTNNVQGWKESNPR